MIRLPFDPLRLARRPPPTTRHLTVAEWVRQPGAVHRQEVAQFGEALVVHVVAPMIRDALQAYDLAREQRRWDRRLWRFLRRASQVEHDKPVSPAASAGHAHGPDGPLAGA